MNPEDRSTVLSTLPATQRTRRLALGVMFVSLCAFLAAAPFAKAPLPQVWAFLPLYQSALIVNDLITAVLLFGQYGIVRARFLLLIACGYLFCALMAAMHLASFPGLFAETGLLAARSQTTAWLYFLWHGGFPLIVLAYALDTTRGLPRPRAEASQSAWRSILAGIVAVILVVGVLTLLTTTGHDLLPPIMQGNRDGPAKFIVASAAWMLSLAALAVLWRRRPHSVLDVWLMVVMGIWIFGIALASVLNGGRFDVGWYAGRVYGLLAASFVLIVLLLENSTLYANLVQAHGNEQAQRLRAEERSAELTLLNNELEQARRAADSANQAKSAFLATVSHEIRTPMNGVLGLLDLLSVTRLDAKQRTTIEILKESGRSLVRIISDILDLSKIEAGKLAVRPEVASIPDIVRRVYNLYSGAASSKGVPLKAVIDPAISPALRVDPLRLQQILNNFVSNAIKFTESGLVQIKAELMDRADGEELVRFSVIDTGIGISPKDQDMLFKAFNQTEGTAARTGGTGLGLVISRQLAGMMGGSIHMESEPGRGTTIVLTLPMPVADPADLPEKTSAEVRGSVATALSSRRPPPPLAQAVAEGTLVLIVDDHGVNRLVLSHHINAMGYAVEDAETGRKALEKWREGRYGLVITDCHMPDMDGYELTRAIRRDEAERGLRRTPVIACTANALDGEAEKCFISGMDDYLTKPVEVGVLMERLDRWLPLPSGPGFAPYAAGNAESDAAIDPAVLAQLARGSEATRDHVVSLFREVNDQDTAALRAAVDSSDIETATHAAHRIKGASYMIGAFSLAACSERIERAGRAGNWQDMRAALQDFNDALQRVNAFLDSLAKGALKPPPESPTRRSESEASA